MIIPLVIYRDISYLKFHTLGDKGLGVLITEPITKKNVIISTITFIYDANFKMINEILIEKWKR